MTERWKERAAVAQRRRFLAGAGLLGLAGCSPPGPLRTWLAGPRDAQVDAMLSSHISVDMHSHAGRVLAGRSGDFSRSFEPLHDPMAMGGMNVICLAVVADSPVTRVLPNRTISAVRSPEPGELYEWALRAFPRAFALVDQERLNIVVDRASLAAASTNGPSVIIASEGADFLEGRIERVDEFYERFSLRHLQMTHYRVNELGDIQTAPGVYGGVSAFGEEVIRRCNQRGIVVDVAHAPLDFVKRAADTTTRPLVLSHTSLAAQPREFSRLISPDHARAIAATGGVIGVWPPAARFPTLSALAGGIADLVDVVGVAHVGIGTDMLGLTGPSVFDSYTLLPDLARELLARGFSTEETGLILGGNYVRVFNASMLA